MAKEIKHEEREHALLSASSAHRWLACPPSAVLAERYGEKSTSSFAEEGTLAHEFCELNLRRLVLDEYSEDEYNALYMNLKGNKRYKSEMDGYVKVYTDYCRDQFVEMRESDEYTELVLEQKLDLTEYIPDGFGTADCVIVSEEVLEIIDFKYGKGVPVYAPYNSQLMIYALGAIDGFHFDFGFERVRMTIVQPRLSNISSFEMSVSDLLEWANTKLKPTAAIANAGAGELATGEHCRFCPVKARCRALHADYVRIAQSELNPNILSDEELTEVFSKSKMVSLFLESVNKYMLGRALSGERIEGFKVVRASSRRAWVSEDAVEKAIKDSGVSIDQDILYTLKLNTLTQIEKAVGKELFAKVFADAVTIVEGNPTLVPESDKRKAIDVSEQARIDIESEESDLD